MIFFGGGRGGRPHDLETDFLFLLVGVTDVPSDIGWRY
jgi:hypothetical protein